LSLFLSFPIEVLRKFISCLHAARHVSLLDLLFVVIFDTEPDGRAI
jgi:hypothetical protein